MFIVRDIFRNIIPVHYGVTGVPALHGPGVFPEYAGDERGTVHQEYDREDFVSATDDVGHLRGILMSGPVSHLGHPLIGPMWCAGLSDGRGHKGDARITYQSPSAPGGGNGADGGGGLQKMFESFLRRHGAYESTITQESVRPADLTSGYSEPLQLTSFKALHDTLMYAVLVEKMLAFIPPSLEVQIIDLGAGSSVPTIRALSKSAGHNRVRVVAVDIDGAAIEISKNNVTLAGAAARYTFVQDDMLHFLSEWRFCEGDVLISNPPYMPIPAVLNDPFYLPVNGGPDGMKYLEPILTSPVRKGTMIAIRWCSLTNPRRMIEMIESDYEVLYLDAHVAPFGTYARLTEKYLEEQQRAGLAAYITDPDGTKRFTFVGSLLRRK
jgi:hypothetical protein